MSNGEASRPSWSAVTSEPQQPEPPPQPARAVDLKIVIAVLIGLVSVTGAAVTWRSAQLGENATDKDRLSIAETVRQQQDAANIEISVQDARSRVADHAAAIVAAQLLEEQAENLSGEAARAAVEEAQDLRVIAERSLLGGPVAFLERYVEVPEGSNRPELDETRLRADLRADFAAANPVDPRQTVRDANELRNESQHFDGWLVALIGAIVLLTLAQVSRWKLARLLLTGAGTSVWVIATVMAFRGP